MRKTARALLAAAAAAGALACGEDLGPCEERVEGFEALVGTWETETLQAVRDADPAAPWYGAALYAHFGGRLTIAAGGGVTIDGRAWDDTLYVWYDVMGTGTATLHGDSVTVAWGGGDEVLVQQPDFVLRFPITFAATLRIGFPDQTDWGLFETVECLDTSRRWLVLRADTASALIDPELDGVWTPAAVTWTLITPYVTAP